ncbi:hypothetical protein ACXDIZ_002125 [Klebsiella pneumoniae]
MIDPKKIEQIARQVHESMPKGLRDLGEEVRTTMINHPTRAGNHHD